jgi:DNA-binding transcriptional LysR family regulator
MLAQALRAASVPWSVAVEASGWELTLHFVSLGLGLAVVNACCRLPPGLVARPLPELPRTVYRLLYRPGALRRSAVASLREALLGPPRAVAAKDQRASRTK